ncbi:hypothetical protein Q4E93_13195 [Flavitalea sp. BT771]|uniref:hypothetical protein n=1 Tax=Flavitalea sp. BT771 TaxID=3063329 RepID=UPI0026E41EE5|nr:hypothetical protein [Flavitalea sp. BT771]MDO6431554.1 hypothetical protein [Flavitalea sp. BT771]MDV6220462.1 hypothetical protein [Flavitalea sp. BT771]
MGSTAFTRVAYGKNADEAYNAACEDAQSENGYQDGYSGDLNAKSGFLLVETPPDVDLSRWLNALKCGKLPRNLEMYSNEFQRQFEIYVDKWEPALCYEVFDKQKRPENKYIFVGYAPE